MLFTAARHGFGETFHLKNKHYIIKGILGEGSFGVVYLVESETGKPRVIKDIKSAMLPILMKGQYYSEEDGYLEAQALEALYLGKQYQGISSDNLQLRWLIKQKYFSGMNFDAAATAENNQERFHQVLDLAFQLAVQQVFFFHGLKMQHGDVKPVNLMVYRDLDNQLNKASHLDFGLVRFLNQKNRLHNQRGTALFIHHKGVNSNFLRPLSGYVDVFGLAISLKLLLTGITTKKFKNLRLTEFLFKNKLSADHLDIIRTERAFKDTEIDIPAMTKIQDSASSEEKAFASFLDQVIIAGEGQGYNPRKFLKQLLALYHDPEYHFPDISAATRAMQIVDLTDQQLETVFSDGNNKFKELSARLKRHLEDYPDDQVKKPDVYETAKSILKHIQNTHPFERSVELAEQLNAQFNNALIKSAAMQGIANYCQFIKDLQSGLITKGPRDNKILGIFTPFRHGVKGALRAERLMKKISDMRSEVEIQTLLLAFLAKKDRRYHKHSLSSFILDELIKTDKEPWSQLVQNEQAHRYEQKMIMSI